ncbi:radical SAM/SPASM domain-containing protein [Blautia obeum]|uniref:radical SAM protein n=1 Tax=Blautia obeum TaxID=40520 RepID=UPI003CFE9C1F
MEFIDNATTLEEAIIQRAKKSKVPVNGSLELLPLCNMNCEMCYVRLSREEMLQKGCLRTWNEWLELARQMVSSGVLFLLLTGGEPLLYPEFQTLYLELWKMGLVLTINTNGTLIDEKWAEFFGKYKPRRINITLYGASAGTYERLCHYPEGFHKVLQGIRLLRKRQIDVKVSCSITPMNYQDVEQIFQLGKELDVPVHIDPYMMPSVRERSRPFSNHARVSPERAASVLLHTLKLQFSEDIYQQYVNQSIERVQNPGFCRGNGHVSCLAGNCSFTINWQGEMRPCVVMSEPSVPVFEIGFQNAWNGISNAVQDICINKECTACNLNPICKICAAAAKLETGRYDGIPEYLCRYSKEHYRLLLDAQKRWNS